MPGLRIDDPAHIIALADEEMVKAMFEGCKLEEIKSWAIVGFPEMTNKSHYWPIINGKTLDWCYDHDYVKDAADIVINILNRDVTFHTVEESPYPLLIRIHKLPGENKQKYILISPQMEDAPKEMR